VVVVQFPVLENSTGDPLLLRENSDNWRQRSHRSNADPADCPVVAAFHPDALLPTEETRAGAAPSRDWSIVLFARSFVYHSGLPSVDKRRKCSVDPISN